MKLSFVCLGLFEMWGTYKKVLVENDFALFYWKNKYNGYILEKKL